MGGGTPLIEANRAGCDVQGFDVDPMSAWIVREEIENLDVAAYEAAARSRRGSGRRGPASGAGGSNPNQPWSAVLACSGAR